MTDRRTSVPAGRSFNRIVTLVALTANFYAISSVDWRPVGPNQSANKTDA